MTKDIYPLYDKKVCCHICNHEFTSKKIRSRSIRVKKTFNDFSKEYKDDLLNPTLYECYVCPDCGFGFSDQFNIVKNEGIRDTFRKQVSANWRVQNYSGERSQEDAIRVYKLAIISARVTKQPYVVTASLCMKLSWIYRTIDNVEEERRFNQHSLNEFEKSFTDGDFASKNMTEMTIIFIIGELNRKLGNYDQAVQFFSKIIQHKNRHHEPQLVEKAREQWYQVRENINR